MRKRLISTLGANAPAPGRDWLQLAKAAVVEVTSEAEGYSIEEALLTDGTRGWRANVPGLQTIRLMFDHPQTIDVIRLVFREEECARTQELAPEWRRLLERYYSTTMEFQPAEHSA